MGEKASSPQSRENPWSYIPAATGQSAARADQLVCESLVRAAIRLGLKTLASEHLAGLSATTRATLAGSVAALRDDSVSREQREQRAVAGVAGLAARGVEISETTLSAWRADRSNEQWFRTIGGSVVRRRETGEWISFSDDVAAARAPIPALARPRPGEKPGPVYIDGIDPPWLLLRVLAERPVLADGFAPRVVVVASDPNELLDALATTDLSSAIRDERVEWIIGPDAGAELESRLLARAGLNLGDTCLSVSRRRGAGSPPATAAASTVAGIALQRAREHQAREGEAAIAAARSQYAGRDSAYWASRYAEALARGSSRPLRVLIPTTRYSTFVQHASADIAAALRKAGCRAEVLIEPDSSSTLVGFGYALAFQALEPDLIIMLNYPRRHLQGVLPDNVPMVCWVQDAMGHLFDPAVGRSQNALEFLVGHVYSEFFDTFGYSRRRALAMPVLASEAKFTSPDRTHTDSAHTERAHTGGATRAFSSPAPHDCEIALITNQSESPAVFRDQYLQGMLAALRAAGPAANSAGAETRITRLVGLLFDGVRSLTADPMRTDFTIGARELVSRAMRETGESPDPRRHALLLNQFCWPLGDRFIRHETVQWAAELARERGWRVHLYGRGWDAHPEFRPLARGPIAHGEPLRAAYQHAAVTLHVSINWNLHQRVLECALSGGLPLCRLKHQDYNEVVGHTAAWMTHRARCAGTLPPPDGSPLLVPIADDPDAMLAMAQCQRLGVVDRIVQGIDTATPWAMRLDARRLSDPWSYSDGRPIAWESIRLLGDLAETCYWSKDTLAAAVERAIARPAWRESTSRAIRTRVRSCLTYESAVTRIINWIAATCAEDAATSSDAASPARDCKQRPDGKLLGGVPC